MPKISVVMPVYNGEKYIFQAIKSILDQTERDFELVIIDDGSTDPTERIISQFSDERIRYIKLGHKGIVHALNMGIQNSTGMYIARMDADDVSHARRLKLQSEYLDQNADIAVCGTWAEEIDEDGKEIGSMVFPPLSPSPTSMLLHNPFIHPSVMIRRTMLENVGYYKEFFRHAEDYELWTRLLSKYKGANIPQKLLKYRTHGGQITATKRFKMRYIGLITRIIALYRIFL